LKARTDCVPCLFRQALNTLRSIKRSNRAEVKVMREIARRFLDLGLDVTPASLSQLAYEAVEKVTGVADPFYEKKRLSNREALEIYPEMKRFVARSSDPLFAAVKVALAGNVIDLGIGVPYNIRKEFAEVRRKRLKVNEYKLFTRTLKGARRVLYIGDNSGEIVFDRVLVEELIQKGRLDITFVVKGGPIINDALMEDAEEAGLTGIVRVIDTGNRKIGVDLRTASTPMKRAFREADLIISKGQGNFESLNGTDRRIFFLLKAKCECVADELGVKVGDWVFLRGGSRFKKR